MIATPQTIAGSFNQSASGVLGLDFAGDAAGEYGALTVTSLISLDGSLAIDLTGGFQLATGDNFDILTSLTLNGLTGDFYSGLSLDGMACSAILTDSWSCGPDVILTEVFLDPNNSSSLDIYVTRGVPEPSTWVMMATGFLSLAGLGLMRRARAA